MIFWLLLLVSLVAALCAAFLCGWSFSRLLLSWVLSYIIVNLIYVLFCCAGAFGVDKSKKTEKQSALCRRGAARLAGFVTAYLRMRINITGMDKLPQGENFLFVCNHRSMADPIVVVDKLRDFNISFICKPSLQKLPIIWRLGHGAGFLAIDRENDREALKTIITAAGYIKSGMCSIGIYPEGTRSKTEELLPFHAGSFKIAQKAGAPLVIASISGTEMIKKNYPFRRTDISLNILETMPAELVRNKSTAELAEYSRNIIGENLKGELVQ